MNTVEILRWMRTELRREGELTVGVLSDRAAQQFKLYPGACSEIWTALEMTACRAIRFEINLGELR